MPKDQLMTYAFRRFVSVACTVQSLLVPHFSTLVSLELG
jgi:hypothetical protein